MKEIGGFFELELAKKKEFHKNAIKLNTGRNSLEYILKSSKYKKIYIPYFICSSILEPIEKVNIEYEHYKLDENFNIELDFLKIKKDSLLLYVNYFGICNRQIDELLEQKEIYQFDLCIDNTQAFFNMPKNEEHTIYSARKFFGVPDGAYLYTNKILNENFEEEKGYNKSIHLMKRIDLGASKAYDDFIECSKLHSYQDIKLMSRVSKQILESIDYKNIIDIRKNNFNYLHKNLKQYNRLNIDENLIVCPMVYPMFIITDKNIRKDLISKGIFVAKYWESVLDKVDLGSNEQRMVEHIIPLPIDQRYNLEDMEYIVRVIKSIIN